MPESRNESQWRVQMRLGRKARVSGSLVWFSRDLDLVIKTDRSWKRRMLGHQGRFCGKPWEGGEFVDVGRHC